MSAVSRAALISGPAKIVRSGSTFFSSDNPQINWRPSLADVATAVHGQVDQTVDDVIVEATFTPAGVFAYRSVLHPFLGTTSGGTEKSRGFDIFTSSDVPTVITGTDGAVYTLIASAVTRPPDLYLGPTRELWGPVTITGVIGNSLQPTAADAFMSVGSTTYSDSTFDPTAIVKQAYSAAWGAVTGFTALVAQDFWTISTEINLSPVRVAGYTRTMKLESIRFMAKCVPLGPTATELEAALKFQGGSTGYGEGHRRSRTAADLVITGTGIVATLKNAAFVSAGYRFGGSELRLGEIGFVSTIAFSSGVPASQLILATS